MTEIIRYSYKLVVVGDSSVGKTSLIRRYADKKFDDSYLPTIGADFTIKRLEFKKENILQQVTLAIWDMGGQQQFSRIRSHYFLDASAALVVFDFTRKETFENLKVWFEDIQQYCGTIPCLILANKNDLPNKAVSKDELDKLASNNKVEIVETSAKTGDNVEKVFDLVANLCLNTYDASP